MNPIAIDLGIVTIYWYSIIMFVAMIIGFYFVQKEARNFDIPNNFISDLGFYTIVFGLIGARLYYVAFNWSYYSNNLLDILKVWEGGLAIHGAIIAGLIFITIYTKKYKLKTLRILDMIVVGLIIGQAIGRWGNFFNGEAHGAITTLEHLKNLKIPNFIIDGMKLNGAYYEPTFLYESLWNLIGFVVLIVVRRLRYIKIGQLTGIYLLWYGFGRFFVEGMRTDSLMFKGIRVAQLASIIMMIIGVIIILIRQFESRFKNQYRNINEVVDIQKRK